MTGRGDDTPVSLRPYDPGWPAQYDQLAIELGRALGVTARGVIHVGSTAVPGLRAKPVIDMVLLVDDPDLETGYLPRLEAIGFRLVVREPGWFSHRMLQRGHPAVNLHVFASGCPEVDRMVIFRDRLRNNPDDRALYAATKERLAAQAWADVQEYATAKSSVVRAIMARTSEGSR